MHLQHEIHQKERSDFIDSALSETSTEEEDNKDPLNSTSPITPPTIHSPFQQTLNKTLILPSGSRSSLSTDEFI